MNSPVAILLVEPENPDNIGAVARAMKNMAFSDLRLLKPPVDWKALGKKMAVAAHASLERAKVFESTEKAIEDAAFVIGTTRRKRRYTANFIEFEEAIQRLTQAGRKKPAILMFGKESKGLSNADLDYCDWVTSIPSNPVYPSINLSQAVMIFAFSLYRSKTGSLIKPDTGVGGDRVSKKEEREVLEVWREALYALDYSNNRSAVVDRIIHTFHGLIKRNGLFKREVQMLKGISRRIKERSRWSLVASREKN